MGVNIMNAIFIIHAVMLTLITSVYMFMSTTHTEQTLTLDNLTSVLEGVPVHCLNKVAEWLHIPFSERRENLRYTPRYVRTYYCDYWLTYHPAPSWKLVAIALWMTEEHAALEVLQKIYLKGKPCVQYNCRSALIN